MINKMDGVICLSSGSDDSDVEVIGSCAEVEPPPPPPPPPLSSVRIDVSAVSDRLPPCFISHNPSGWTFPRPRILKGPPSAGLGVIDLTKCDSDNGTGEEMDHLLLGKIQTSDRNGKKDQFVRDLTILNCGTLVPKQICLDSQTQNCSNCDVPPAVRLKPPPSQEEHLAESETSTSPVQLTMGCAQMSLGITHIDINRTVFDDSCVKATAQESEFMNIPMDDKPHHSSINLPIAERDLSGFPGLEPLFDPSPTSGHKPAEDTFKCQFGELKVERASKDPDLSSLGIANKYPVSVFKREDTDEEYREFLETASPPLLWQEESEEANELSRFDLDFRAASQEDRDFVCPVALKKIMSGPYQALTGVEDEGFGTPKRLCRQSLSLVYITMEENFTEGTLQLLSDLLQPGYFPPREITVHLLHNVLLRPKCSLHLCVQAFNLLMRSQRHHMADKTTVPWDWELLTTVMTAQDSTKRHHCEIVRMFLEYVLQTLEDDFRAKRSVSALHESIGKSILSCDQQFPRVREVIKWLFTAIQRSREFAESGDAPRESDEQTRIMCVLQRMLSLALKVDHSPVLSSVKLSQELFHMLISKEHLRAHRMLLLESLESTVLRCKLLELLLDYACPVKTSLPMSLGLLLHFLRSCILPPDPTDGTEKWQSWEELVHLLWMLLLSYNKTIRGFLCSSGRASTMIYKPDDKISRSAIHEAMDTFLSRSSTDIGHALPLHVETSLTYLQDQLLDVCQH